MTSWELKKNIFETLDANVKWSALENPQATPVSSSTIFQPDI